MKRRLLFVLFVMVVCIIVSPLFIYANSDFAGGDGTAENPYQITNKYQLDQVRNYPDANFILMNDIVFEDSDFKEGGDFFNATGQTFVKYEETIIDGGWKAIPELNGTFDGNHHVIANLHQYYVGYQANSSFITKIGKTGTIKNLHLKNVDFITSYENALGGIASYNEGMIQNCTTSGKIAVYHSSGLADGPAGIVKKNNGTITNSANFIHFISGNATSNFGGIAVHNNGIIQNCINAGGISSLGEKYPLSTYPLSTQDDGIVYGDNYKVSALYGICVSSSGVIKDSLNMVDAGIPVMKNTGSINNLVCAFGKNSIFDDSGIKYTTRASIKVEDYTINEVAKAYLTNINVSDNVSHLISEGYTYKSIKISWEPVANATGYRIYRYVMDGRNTSYDPIYQRRPIDIDKQFLAEITADEGCSYIDKENITSHATREYHYCVAPVFIYDGVEFIGSHTRSTSARTVDITSSSASSDSQGPYIDDVTILTKETYLPSAIKIRIKAQDNMSEIVSVKICYNTIWTHENGTLCNLTGWENFEGNYGYDMDKVFTLSNDQTPNCTKPISSIIVTDSAGNTSKIPLSVFDYTIPKVTDEFDIEFNGTLSNGNIVRELERMEEGKTVVLTVDEVSKGILKKEILDAIKGQDKTVVVYLDNVGSKQWVFKGLDITGETKDLDLGVGIKKEDGSILGLKSDLLEMTYADNGVLPGKANFRVKSDYLNAIYEINSSLHLYYKNGKKVEKENTSCEAIKEGNSYWCYIDLYHNSTFYLAGEEANTTELIESNHVCSYDSNTTKTIKKAGFNKEGEQQATCTVCQQTVTKPIAAAVVPVIADQTFNNKNKTPKITVVDADGNTIESKATFANKTRKAVGRYAVKITLTGDNYSGTETVYFSINPAGKSISKVSAGKKALTVKWKKASSKNRKQMTGYQIRYSTSTKMTKAKTVTVKNTKATSKTIKKLKAKKTYYVQLRTYKTVKGAKYYSTWSKIKKVKTK